MSSCQIWTCSDGCCLTTNSTRNDVIGRALHKCAQISKELKGELYVLDLCLFEAKLHVVDKCRRMLTLCASLRRIQIFSLCSSRNNWLVSIFNFSCIKRELKEVNVRIFLKCFYNLLGLGGSLLCNLWDLGLWDLVWECCWKARMGGGQLWCEEDGCVFQICKRYNSGG